MFSPVKLCIIAALLFLSTHTTSAHANRALPSHLATCFDQLIKKMLLIDPKDKAAAKAFFLANTDVKLLTRRSLGGRTWKHATKEWREAALDLYFHFLFENGGRLTEGMKNVHNTVISARLADRPDTDESKGFWHIPVTVRLDNGNLFSVAVFMTNQCKMFDLYQGAYFSKQVTATDVDIYLRAQRTGN